MAFPGHLREYDLHVPFETRNFQTDTAAFTLRGSILHCSDITWGVFVKSSFTQIVHKAIQPALLSSKRRCIPLSPRFSIPKIFRYKTLFAVEIRTVFSLFLHLFIN
ncbi:hypothetical protein L1887_12141 [Cichorium endivia]|nr:hypothetical protein L1887_12141 [Cichorium endivia]